MLFQKLSGNIPDTQETFWKLTETLETLFGNHQATFRTLRKCSGNSGNVPETQEMFRKLTWTLETPFGNPQSTPGHSETS